MIYIYEPLCLRAGETFAKIFGRIKRLTDSNDRQHWRSFHVHRQRRLLERRPVIIDGYRVMWVIRIAGDVADDWKLARWVWQRFLGDERRDWLREVDAVDEDIGLDDFPERTAGWMGGWMSAITLLDRGLMLRQLLTFCFLKIPLEDRRGG